MVQNCNNIFAETYQTVGSLTGITNICSNLEPLDLLQGLQILVITVNAQQTQTAKAIHIYKTLKIAKDVTADLINTRNLIVSLIILK